MKTTTRSLSSLFLTGTLVLLAGCAGSGVAPETRRRVAVNVATWTGRDRDQVLAVLGEPATTEPDGRGGSILVYRELKRKISWAVTQEEASPSPADDLSGDPIRKEPRQLPVQDRSESAKFWLDDEGKVYRFWFAPELYEKGKVPRPPPRPEAPDEPDS